MRNTITTTGVNSPSPQGEGLGEGPANSQKTRSRRMLRTQLMMFTGALLLLAGCAAGPSYKPPKITAPEKFANAVDANFSTNETAVTWWRGFNDAELNQLVDRAISSNLDLKVATANIIQARALRREAAFDLGPVVNGTAGYTRSLYAQAFEPGVARSDRNLRLYDVGFDATWELDFFGRVRRTVQAGTADMEAAEANRRNVFVTMLSEVARNYFELRGNQEELAAAERNATNQQQTLQITEAIRDGGRGTELDVARARAQLNNTLANIPPLEGAISHAIHRLGVLTGQRPEALIAELQTPAPLPVLPSLVSISNPETLLRRRPDVRSAERSLAAATARIGVATADLFPRVTFNGNIGLEATSIAGLNKGGADNWSFGPAITWALLDYGHVQSRMKAAGAVADAALATYQSTVLATLEDTENSLVDFYREQSRQGYLRESEKASETAATLARRRYEDGATDFLTVLDAERVLFEAQDQLAQSNTRTATALVAVYKSLGGGWEVESTSAK